MELESSFELPIMIKGIQDDGELHSKDQDNTRRKSLIDIKQEMSLKNRKSIDKFLSSRITNNQNEALSAVKKNQEELRVHLNNMQIGLGSIPYPRRK